jgi:hypothetical protein
MKFQLALLLCLLCCSVFAQQDATYKDFIQQDNKIQWVAEYDQLIEITPAIKKFGIRELLSQQIAKKGYIDNYHIQNEKLVMIKSFTIDSFRSAPDIYKGFDININQLDSQNPFVINEQKCSCEGGVQKNKFDVYKIKQLLYYANAKLYIKNVLVTPLCLKRIGDADANGYSQLVWQSAYSSCYNGGSPEALTPQLKRKCVDLGNSEAEYDLRYDPMDSSFSANVLTKKKPYFPHHLYQDLIDGKITAVNPVGYKVIPAKKVIGYGVPIIEVPVYDSDGVQIGVRKTSPEVNIDSFYNYGINQHFYFDSVNDKLYSEINYINVYENVVTSQGINLGSTVIYRVYFILPSLFKKPVAKRFLD